jgi:hypothetical protein
MNTITFDALEAISRLQQAGFTEPQARSIVHTIKDIDLSELATKGDIKDLRADMREMELRIKLQVGGMLAVSVGILATLIVVFGRLH